MQDIEQFLGDHVFLRHNMVTGRVECRRTKTSRGYIVVQRSPEEIRSRLRMMADVGRSPTGCC